MLLAKFSVLLGVMFTCSLAVAGPAINQFELKDLEAEAGSIEFQSQNAHAFSQPKRHYQQDGSGEFEYDDNSVVQQRHALELEFGVTDSFRTRVGIEFEKERVEEPRSRREADHFSSLKLEELAVEAVLVFVPVLEDNLGIGMLVEYQHTIEKEEANSLVFGPIFEVAAGMWSATTNLTLVHFFGGDTEERDNKWDFAYAAQLMYQASPTWDLALEAYGTIDRLGNTGTRSEEAKLFGDHNQHRLGPVAYYALPLAGDDTADVVIGMGLLFGLNNNTPDFTLKWSVEAEF